MAPEAEGDDRPPQSDERVGSMLSGFQLVSMDGGDKEGRCCWPPHRFWRCR